MRTHQIVIVPIAIAIAHHIAGCMHGSKIGFDHDMDSIILPDLETVYHLQLPCEYLRSNHHSLSLATFYISPDILHFSRGTKLVEISYTRLEIFIEISEISMKS